MICKVNDACAACPDNATVACPMFIWSMSFDQLVAWMRSEMKDQNITHQKLADLSGIPKNTIDTILAGRQHDVGHYVLSSLVRVLMRRYLSASPCRAAALASKDETIADLRAQLKEARETNATHRGTIADLRSQVKKYETAAKAAAKAKV